MRTARIEEAVKSSIQNAAERINYQLEKNIRISQEFLRERQQQWANEQAASQNLLKELQEKA